MYKRESGVRRRLVAISASHLRRCDLMHEMTIDVQQRSAVRGAVDDVVVPDCAGRKRAARASAAETPREKGRLARVRALAALSLTFIVHRARSFRGEIDGLPRPMHVRERRQRSSSRRHAHTPQQQHWTHGGPLDARGSSPRTSRVISAFVRAPPRRARARSRHRSLSARPLLSLSPSAAEALLLSLSLPGCWPGCALRAAFSPIAEAWRSCPRRWQSRESSS